MRTVKLLLVCLLWLSSCKNSQPPAQKSSTALPEANMQRIRATIDTLCSAAFMGRGYVDEGANKAAAYLAEQFASIGLNTINGNYLQPFRLNVNSFPGQAELKVNGLTLKPGIDFLPQPMSGSVAEAAFNTDRVLHISTASLAKPDSLADALPAAINNYLLLFKFADQELLLQHLPLRNKALSAGGWLNTSPTLTHSYADMQLPFPWLLVKEELLPAKVTSISFTLSSQLLNNYEAFNVVGAVPAAGKTDVSAREKYLVFTAHYDHLGAIGSTYFPGANDNASGVAMLLELARWFEKNPLPVAVVLIATGGEEAGLAGSSHLAEHPLLPLKNIQFLFNVDLYGSGDNGGTVVNATLHPERFSLLQQLNSRYNLLPRIGERGPAANSDHYPFSQKNVPAFFMYLEGDWQHYHHPADAPPLPLDGFEASYQLIIKFMESVANE
jgi:hypothetical protein